MQKSTLTILMFISGFLLNIAYTFYIVPHGENTIRILETEVSGENPQAFANNSDTLQYITLAINLKEGRGFVYPFEDPKPTAYRMPGFPIFLCLIFSQFGVKINIALLFQCVLLTFLFYIAYILAKMVFSPQIALISFAVMLFWPNLKFYGCAYLASETLSTLLFYIFLLCTLKGENAHSSGRWLLAGILSFAGAVYTRPDYILFTPFLCFWLFRHYAGGWKTALLAIVIFSVSLTPWTVRNFRIFNAFIPTTTGVGAVLTGSYNPTTLKNNPGGWDRWSVDKNLDTSVKEKLDNEVLLNQYQIKQGLEFITQIGPLQWVQLIFWKTVRMWFPAQRLIRTQAGLVHFKEIMSNLPAFFSSPLKFANIILTIICLPIYVLFWIQFSKNLRDFRKNELFVYFFLYVYFIAILFWGSLRFRFAFEPIIIMYGCSFLQKNPKI